MSSVKQPVISSFDHVVPRLPSVTSIPFSYCLPDPPVGDGTTPVDPRNGGFFQFAMLVYQRVMKNVYIIDDQLM